MSLEIHSVQFGEDGLAITFMDVPTDVRVEGRVIQTRSLQLHASHPDYRADMEDLHRRAERVLRNALEDFADSPPFDPEKPGDDEDDEKGMGE